MASSSTARKTIRINISSHIYLLLFFVGPFLFADVFFVPLLILLTQSIYKHLQRGDDYDQEDQDDDYDGEDGIHGMSTPFHSSFLFPITSAAIHCS